MAKIIKGWEDLVGLESNNYYIKVDLKMGCGWIVPKDRTHSPYSHYLSTHTFYGKTYKGYESLLHNCGFDVKLVSWDGGE